MLFGRDRECAQIDRLLEGARAGRSGVLVVSGEPGIGKTTLLRYASDRAAGMRMLSVTGVASEAAFAFAALGRLATPLNELTASPPAQPDGGLRCALDLRASPPADRFAAYA